MQQVVCYCRVSTLSQAENDNIELQVESLTKYAEKQNLHIAEWFKDEGVSGGLEERPALAHMMIYLESRAEVQVILVYSLTRLARDLYIQEGLIREFAKLGKQVVSLTEPDLGSNDPTRKLFRQVIGAFAEFERAMITLRMKSGRDSAVAKGGWHGGQVYGYDSKDGQLVINQKEAEVVKKIFYLRRYQKMTASGIANYLNERSIPTKRKTTAWHSSTINKILINKIYRGILSYKGRNYNANHEKIL
jgi:site-specific DNA recombinase